MTDKRAEVNAAIDGHTLPTILARTAEQLGAAKAYGDQLGPDPDEWRWVSWQELRDQALALAATLLDLGVERGDTVAIFAGNRIEHIVADHAVLQVGAAVVPIYLTFSAEQVAYVVEHCQPKLVLVEGSEQAALVPSRVPVVTLPALGQSLDADQQARVEERAAEVQPDDRATILYTSGTTGPPKGVVLTHRNILFSVRSGADDEPARPWIARLGYLPLAHIAERMMSLYVPLWVGGHVTLVRDLDRLTEALRAARPMLFLGPPRIWEKLLSTVHAHLAELPGAERDAANAAMACAERWVRARQFGEVMTPQIEADYLGVEPTIKELQALVGLDRCAWTASAAAPQPGQLAWAWAELGVPLYDVYGMTETTASICSSGEATFRLGTVGRAVDGIELKLADDGELLARGPMNTTGYFHDEQASGQLIDSEGWLHTGDIASIDADGFVSIVDRKKELIITSTGKNIAPSNIEARLKSHPLISQALVVGDNRPYLVALLCLDAQLAPLLLANTDDETELERTVTELVASANAALSRPEQVKRWTLVPEEWTPETGELTATMKLRRTVIAAQYAEVIDAMYAQSSDQPELTAPV